MGLAFDLKEASSSDDAYVALESLIDGKKLRVPYKFRAIFYTRVVILLEFS